MPSKHTPRILAFGGVLAAFLSIGLSTPGAASARERGENASRSELRTAPLPRPSGLIHAWSPNFNEEVDVNIYNEDGSFNQDALASLDSIFRDRRNNEVRAVDPHLYEILSLIYDHFGQHRIELDSGFRIERGTSRHFNASAMDIRVEGVYYMDVYRYACTLDEGGMGIGRYPREDFVHVDFRAPGEPSYRWVDDSGPPRRPAPVRKPHSKRNT